MGATNWYENNNYIDLPPDILSLNNVYTHIGASNIVPGNIFNIRSTKSFWNDNAMTHGHILHYFMTSQYHETLDWVTNSQTSRRVKWNENQNRLYMDFDWEELQSLGDFILVDCTIRQDPNLYTRMFNEH